MYNILIFAGTTEGRMIVEKLAEQEVALTVCVATEYGEKPLPQRDNVNILAKRLDQLQIRDLISSEKIELVIDATHPYAVEVTKNILAACAETEVECIRIKREESEWSKGKTVYVEDMKACISYLEKTEGNVLLTTGSKELSLFTELPNYQERLFARVLSTPQVISDCAELGFEGRHLICMQGPFSEELNYALLKEIEADYMVTKESGTRGGFYEKIDAAERAGVIPVVVGRPLKEEGFSYEEALFAVYQRLLINLENEIDLIGNGEESVKVRSIPEERKKINLVGIGSGSYQVFTIEADECFRDCDVILGAKRMLECVKHYKKPMFNEYKGAGILEFIQNHPEYSNIAIALSGDTGFYSGAKSLLNLKEELQEYEIKLVPGISSLVIFAAKLQVSWDNAKLISLHGREVNYIKIIGENKKTFSLLGNKITIGEIAKQLTEHGLGEVRIVLGENLSYPDELITEGTAEQFAEELCTMDSGQLYVAYFENNQIRNSVVTHGIEDEEFIREQVPMTKMEVRSISLSKLRIKRDSVIYDIGAGTGSVAIECGLQAVEGTVYAIEKNPDAVELIEKNKRKFGVSNVNVIHGTAPEQLAELPVPNCAFIGGSSGNLREIIKALLEKNPKVNLVINAITLETLSEAIICIKELMSSEYDIVQINVARSKKISDYNMMTGLNPVYIISCGGEE